MSDMGYPAKPTNRRPGMNWHKSIHAWIIISFVLLEIAVVTKLFGVW